jgi:hypothetical protein
MILSRKILLGTVAASGGVFVSGILGALSPEYADSGLLDWPQVFLLSVMVFAMHLLALFLSRERVRQMSLSALLVSSTLCPWISIPIVDKSMTVAEIFLIPDEAVEAPVLAVSAMAAYIVVTVMVIIITEKVVRRLRLWKNRREKVSA